MDTIWRNTFLVGGFFILLVALLKVVNLTLYSAGTENPAKIEVPAPTAAPTASVEPPPEVEAPTPEKQTIKIFDHNPTFGPYYAPLELVVFINPDCTPCRAAVKRTIQDLSVFQSKLKIIYKLLPASAEKNDGAVFSQMALGHGVFPKFWEDLLNYGETLDVRQLVSLLEENGVLFEKQRSAIATQIPIILGELQKDVEQAERLNVDAQQSAFFLNGYALKAPLRVENVNNYAASLLAGQPITPTK